MANTFSCLRYHIIFSTKARQNLLPPDSLARVWEYIGGVIRKNEAIPVAIGGTQNHVHLLVGTPQTISLPDLVCKIKSASTGWIKENFEDCSDFAWQDGYAVFSVSVSNQEEVSVYISNQIEHHRTKSFEEEFRAFLVRHGVKFDEKYLWG